MIILINDLNDPRLEPYRSVKDRDLRGREGAFMAEGKVVLERLFASRLCQTLSVLTTPERLSALDVSNLSEDVDIYVVEQGLMSSIVGFDIHRGYLALGRYVGPIDFNVIWQRPRLRVMGLSAIANTDNMGGLMRNAAAFGIDLVVLDHACCDPFYRKALRVSVGGALSVPHVRLSQDEDLVGYLMSHSVTSFALSPRGVVTLDQVMPDDRSAIILGAEGPGLSPEIMAQCQTVRIDMRGGFDSLNVATTGGIVLYHFCR